MKSWILIFIPVLGGLCACSTEPGKQVATAEPTPLVADPISKAVFEPSDTNFYSSMEFFQIGILNGLDMLFKKNDTLHIVGYKEDVSYIYGENINAFLRKHLNGMDSMDLHEIRIIDWSSDLRGDDDEIFEFDPEAIMWLHDEHSPKYSLIADHEDLKLLLWGIWGQQNTPLFNIDVHSFYIINTDQHFPYYFRENKFTVYDYHDNEPSEGTIELLTEDSLHIKWSTGEIDRYGKVK